MRHIHRLLLIFTFILCFGAPCLSQNADSLSVEFISAQYPQCPDTAFLSSSYQGITVIVRNHDSTSTFTGQLQINFKTQNDTLATDSVIINGGQLVTIPPNDTGLFVFQSSYVFPSNVYRLGSSVVVVWPASATIALKVVDSLFTCINLQLTSGLHDPIVDHESIFPNPAFKVLNIYPAIEKITEEVRIYDALGQLVYTKKLNGNSIPVDFLNPGLYVLEIITKDKRPLRKQFLKE